MRNSPACDLGVFHFLVPVRSLPLFGFTEYSSNIIQSGGLLFLFALFTTVLPRFHVFVILFPRCIEFDSVQSFRIVGGGTGV